MQKPVQPARLLLWAACLSILAFLMVPILSIVPLSFNSEPFFTYPMPGLSMRWYQDFFGSPNWQLATRNSFLVAILSTLIATTLGTLAALGLARPDCPFRRTLMAVLISPIVIPIVVAALGIFYFYSSIGLAATLTGMVIAHAALGAPFVVITVLATLSNFDMRVMRAAASLGAPPVAAFRLIMLPLISPGVAAGAIFAFVTSFDEVVIALFLAGSEQRTLPRQMWSGLREQISPTITAVATLLILLAAALMFAANALQTRSQRRCAA